MAAALALATVLTGPAAAQPVGTGQESGAGAGLPAGSGAAIDHVVTLITGDRVALDEHGEVAGLIRAEGRESVAVKVTESGASTYVIPQDVLPLIADATLDRRLFDVAELSRDQYRSADGLPLIVSYDDDRRGARAELYEAAGTGRGDRLDAIGGEALTVPVEDTAAFWDALTTGPAAGDRQLAATPGIASVALDGIVETALDVSVPQIGAPTAWDAGYDGAGVTIAVLDTGISDEHPDVAGQVAAAANFSGATGTEDRHGHGTHVASIAAGTGERSGGTYTGVAPGASLLNAKVLDDTGSGWESGIIQGMEWAVEQGADVVNMSLGGSATDQIDPMEEAVNALSAASDALFVVAAGNAGPDAGTLGTPGTADAALTLGAVDSSGQLADFSSTGPRLRDGALKPDVTAPGVSIGAAASPGSLMEQEGAPVADGYVSLSGTSMATPHAAGAAALLAQARPGWTGEQLKAALTASARPGTGYGAFQQGAGLIDVTAAIGQSVVTEETSLSFGAQPAPEDGGAPVTRELTYENLGTEDVTLDLAATATGPDGAPAPQGTFALGTSRVTVPAGGTASVEVTADVGVTRTAGPYSLTLTATGGGQTVTTAGAVQRERRMHTLTLDVTGQDGAATGDWFGIIINLETGEAVFPVGSRTIRLPEGDYLVDLSIPHTPQGAAEPTGYAWMIHPALSLTGDTTQRVDAATAVPVSLTGPEEDGEQTELTVGLDLMAPGGGGYGTIFLASGFPDGLRTAQLGAVPEGWEAYSSVGSTWQHDGREYHLAATQDGAFFTGLTQHVRRRELALITTHQGTTLPDRTGHLITATPLVPWAAEAEPGRLPRTTEVYVQAGVSPWGQTFWQEEAEAWVFEAHYFTGPVTYTPGRRYERTFNTGVFGPKIGADEGLFRSGNYLFGVVNPFGDGAGHSGESVTTSASTTLYRNGEPYATADDIIDHVEFEVPPGEADYELVTTATRPGMSTEVTASYTFTSAATPEDEMTRLPATAVRFAPDLSLDGTARAGRTSAIPVTVQGSAAGRALEELTVSVSYDGGAHWREVPVRHGEIRVDNPRRGGTVSLRAEASDRHGNIVTQTIVDAYRTR